MTRTNEVHALRSIPKNRKGEEVRITVETFNGTRLLNLRVWYPDEDGVMRPGRQGISMRAEMVPDVRDALILMAENEEGHHERP